MKFNGSYKYLASLLFILVAIMIGGCSSENKELPTAAQLPTNPADAQAAATEIVPTATDLPATEIVPTTTDLPTAEAQLSGENQIGFSIVFEVDGEFTSAQLQETANTLQRRFNALKLDGNIRVISDKQIQVEVQGVNDPEYVVSALQPRSFLELVDFSGLASQAQNYQGQLILTDKQVESGFGNLTDASALRHPTTNQPFHTGLTGECLSAASAQSMATGADVKLWVIQFEVASDCVGAFANFTQSLLGEPMAIVLDGRVISAPIIQAQLSTGGVITGQFTEEEARMLALQLRSGTLPLELTLASVEALGDNNSASTNENDLPTQILDIETSSPQTEVPQATIIVNNLLDDPRGCPDRCTLRSAIATAQSGDVIGFSDGLSGEIVLAQPLVIDKDLTIVGSSSDTLALDGNGEIQILTITQGNVEIYDLTIQNGLMSGYQQSGGGISNNGSLALTRVSLLNNAAWDGGGIYSTGSLYIFESQFTNNHASDSGGAIHHNSGEMIIHDATFTSNHSENSGGAITAGGSNIGIQNTIFRNNVSDVSGGAATLAGETLTITRSTFAANASEDGAALSLLSRNFAVTASHFYGNQSVDNPDIINIGAGGAIMNRGVGLVQGSTFIGNIGGVGGALANVKNATIEIVDSQFTANISPASGGAIYNQGDLTIERSSFNDNRANRGAGIAYSVFNDSYVFINLTTFFRNVADLRGGAIMFSNPMTRYNTSLMVTSSTLIQNSAVEGNGIFIGEHTYSDENASVQLTNTILANGGADSIGDIVGEFTSLGNNLISNTNGSIGGWFASDLQNISPEIEQICELNGLMFLPLPANSPAIDAGYCEGLNTDQLGTSRETICDIGAYEYSTILENAVCQSTNVLGVLGLPDGNPDDFVFLTPTLPPSPTVTATFTPTATNTSTATPMPTPTEFGILEPTPTENDVHIISVVGVGDVATEGIILQNVGSQSISLHNWTLSDVEGNVYTFGEQFLFSNAEITLYTRSGGSTPTSLFWGLDMAIITTGNTLMLRDNTGVLQSVFEVNP